LETIQRSSNARANPASLLAREINWLETLFVCY
jgi:hypothetical protein